MGYVRQTRSLLGVRCHYGVLMEFIISISGPMGICSAATCIGVISFRSIMFLNAFWKIKRSKRRRKREDKLLLEREYRMMEVCNNFNEI